MPNSEVGVGKEKTQLAKRDTLTRRLVGCHRSERHASQALTPMTRVKKAQLGPRWTMLRGRCDGLCSRLSDAGNPAHLEAAVWLSEARPQA